MKGLNIALTVVILLLAIVSAVFSFFLFEKREQLTKGWQKMATEINRTAKVLDTGSGSSSASQLTEANLAHTKYADLDTSLKALSAQADKIIKERDAFATALREVAFAVEMPQDDIPSLEQLKSLSSFSDSSNNIIQSAKVFNSKYSDLARDTADVARLLGLNVVALDVKNNGPKVNQDVNTVIKSNIATISAYKSGMQEMARQLTDKEHNIKAEVVPDSIEETVSSILGAVDATKKEWKNSREVADRMSFKIKELTEKITNSDGRITTLMKDIDDKLEQIRTLTRIITKGKEVEIPQMWLDGSPEARLHVRGKVLRSSDKYGVIAVDLGSDTTVDQDILGMNNPAKPMIPEGAVLSVVRGDGPDAKLIGLLRVVNVGKRSLTAELISGSGADNSTVKVNDWVYLSKDEVARLSKLKNAE